MEDERYRRGQIYTIRNIKDDTMIYVGSTIDNLSKRFHRHKVQCKSGHSITLYSHIVDNDWSDWYIELYEMYPCNNKKELCRREGQVIREIGTINKKIEGRTKEKWYEDNKEKVSQYHKELYNDNKEKISQKHKEYYERNKEELIQKKKEWNEKNKEKVLEYKKEYIELNKEKISQKLKEYYERNKEEILQKVCCNICGAFLTKSGLKRHQRTKKCMEALNNTTSNIQDCE